MNIYQRYLRGTSGGHFSQIIDQLSTLPPFKTFQKQDILDIVGKCVIHLYPTNSVLFKEQEETNCIFIIRTGRVRLLKTLDFAIDPLTKNIVYEAFQGPDLKDYKRNLYKKITLEIDEYGTGEILGIDSFLNNSKLQFTAITAIPAEIIIMTHLDLMKILTPDVKDGLKATKKSYPLDYDLRRMYLQRIRWEKFKKNFLLENNFRSDYKRNKDIKIKQPKTKLKKPNFRMPSDLIGYLNTKELDDPFIRKVAEITTIRKQLETMDPTNLMKVKHEKYGGLNKSTTNNPFDNLNNPNKRRLQVREASFTQKKRSNVLNSIELQTRRNSTNLPS